jgi:hypothetical protein
MTSSDGVERTLPGSSDCCEAKAANSDAVEIFNRGCRFITVNEEELRRALEADLAEAGLPSPLVESHPHLFAESPVFLSRRHAARMAEIVRAVEIAVQTDGYRQEISQWAPAAASRDPGALGVFFGYDFHLGPEGPRLIEINTNAGGALFNTYLAQAQQACCPEIEERLVGSAEPAAAKDAFVDMFRTEWHLQAPGRDLRSVAIIDDAPLEQPMYPEFVLFQRLFERAGIEALVADPRACAVKEGALWIDGAKIDLVYNRVCDFYLESPEHEALRAAYASGVAVVTPHPRAYALYADKRNLTLLSSEERLRDFGVDAPVIGTLTSGIPATERVTARNADDLWARRRDLFFKPGTSYGSRGAYRGAKLTRRVWNTIVSGDYVAQDLVRPSEREILFDDGSIVLKVDLRCYVYAGEIQFLAARLYRGQTANLRTPGGGFAPVFTEAG